MAGSRVIKNRIRSTKNIQQITKAMQAVSAVKMRKSEHTALQARPYSISTLEILRNILSGTAKEELALHPFLIARPVKKILAIVVTSDKGLAGAFNSNVVRKTQEFIKNTAIPVDIIAVGKRGRDFFSRRKAVIVGEFFESGDFVQVSEISPIADMVLSRYRDGLADKVVIIYTNFLSALKQEVIIRELLPLSLPALESIINDSIPQSGHYSGLPRSLFRGVSDNGQYIFEPSALDVFDTLLPDLLRIEMYHSILEANASEHSSRMVAMKNASQNARDLIGSLTVQYNKMRQAQITKELIEITAGSEVLRASA